MTHAEVLALALSSATIPPELHLLVAPAEAWAVVSALLAVACGVLWFLTRPPRPTAPGGHTPRPVRTGRPVRPRPGLAYTRRPDLSET